jgi:hypothetical protein
VPKQPTSEYWAVDSAATDHMCNNKQAFTGQLIPRKTIIKLGDHSEVHSDFYGHIVLTSNTNANTNTNTTIRALYVPEFRIYLLSVRQLDKDGWTATFGNGKAVLRDYRSVCLTVPSVDNLYRFKLHQLEEAHAVTTRSKARTQQTTQPTDMASESTEEMVSTKDTAIPEDTVSTEDTVTPEDTASTEDIASIGSQTLETRQSRNNPSSMDLWHRRLAHLHPAFSFLFFYP